MTEEIYVLLLSAIPRPPQTGPYQLLDPLVPVRRDSVGAIVAYYGQEPADGIGSKTTPFILRDVRGQHVLYELRDVRPDSLVEGAPRRLRAGPTDTTLRTWHKTLLLI